MIIKEFRIILPMTVEEYQVAQLYSVAEASKNETGGGEGIEVVHNCKFDVEDPEQESFMKPSSPLEACNVTYTKGQYTQKIYHLEKKVPRIVRAIAPKDSLKIYENAWNSYPYCRTIVTNPDYMKENFYIKIESMHIKDKYNIENVHTLTPDQLARREVVYIDIVNDPLYSSQDYKPEHDPTKFQSSKTGRGPLNGKEWWRKMGDVPVMCAYKLVTCQFRWFGLQSAVESMIIKQEQRIFQNFHRQVFCWTDKWYGMTMDDIRVLEDKTKDELDNERLCGVVKGTKVD